VVHGVVIRGGCCPLCLLPVRWRCVPTPNAPVSSAMTRARVLRKAAVHGIAVRGRRWYAVVDAHTIAAPVHGWRHTSSSVHTPWVDTAGGVGRSVGVSKLACMRVWVASGGISRMVVPVPAPVAVSAAIPAAQLMVVAVAGLLVAATRVARVRRVLPAQEAIARLARCCCFAGCV
jgi:hypothetical protein